MAFRYSVRVSRCSCGRVPGFGAAAAAPSSSRSSRATRRVYVAGSGLVRHLFPELGVGGDVAEQTRIELEIAGEIDPVMAIDAIALDGLGHEPLIRAGAVQVPGEHDERDDACGADQRHRDSREFPPRLAHGRPRQLRGHCIVRP